MSVRSRTYWRYVLGKFAAVGVDEKLEPQGTILEKCLRM